MQGRSLFRHTERQRVHSEFANCMFLMGTYLARWRFTPQSPLRRAHEQPADAVQHWLTTQYPTIRTKARQQKGVIFWGDETGLRADDVRGRCYCPRDQAPVVRPSQKRASIGLTSAVTNKGEVRWMVLWCEWMKFIPRAGTRPPSIVRHPSACAPSTATGMG
jgi:Winged helix-turn helix